MTPIELAMRKVRIAMYLVIAAQCINAAALLCVVISR